MTLDTLDIILVATLVVAAMWTVMTARLLRAAIGLAGTSAVLTLIMFRLNSPLAAVFELSVCAGLIPAIFISAIGLTRRLDPESLVGRRKSRLRRYWLLPILVVAVGAGLVDLCLKIHGQISTDFIVKTANPGLDVRTVLWTSRHLDILGQILILLGGAFAVVVLLKEKKRD